jgi:hypothetical protein
MNMVGFSVVEMVADLEDRPLHQEAIFEVMMGMETSVKTRTMVAIAGEADRVPLMVKETTEDIAKEVQAQEDWKRLRMPNFRFPGENPTTFQMYSLF